jgi:hypothetical protein
MEVGKMLTFCGFDIELHVDAVLARRSGPSLCCASDSTGARWLIVKVDDDPFHLAWLCVPVSERAMQAVATGRAAARDAIQHSFTGTVELVAVDHGRAVPDRCLLCSDIPERLLPADDRVLVAA